MNTTYYRLPEDMEDRIYRAREILGLISSLTCSMPAKGQITLTAEQLGSLVDAVIEMLPVTSGLDYVVEPNEAA